jgi:hypothetical protein
MAKKIVSQFFVVILILLLPGVCLADEGQVVITSFYSGISVSLIFFIASMLNAGYIFNFLIKNKARSVTLFSLGLFWFFCGSAALLLSLSSYLHSILHVQSFLLDKIIYLVITGHGFSIAYYVVYKNFYNKKIALTATIGFSFCIMIYSYFLIIGKWRGVVYSDWGTVVLPPAEVKYMAIFLGAMFCTFIFVDFFIRIYRAIKEKSRQSKFEFAIDLPIVIFYLAGTLQMNDLPGWRLVLDQTFMVVAALIMFILIYQTSGLPLLLEKEMEMSKRNK